MELETFDGWTIDRRLKQLRKVRESDDKILFVDFDSDLGQMIFEKKLLVEELANLNNYTETKNENDPAYFYVSDEVKNELVEVEKVINKLERELI